MAKRKDIDRGELVALGTGLLRTVGYRGFSFRDLAESAGIRAASVHHHFPTKGHLLSAIVAAHREALNRDMALVAAETDDFGGRLRRVIDWFRTDDGDGAMAPMAMALAAEAGDFPAPALEEWRLLEANRSGWIGRFYAEARTRGSVPREVEPATAGAAWFAALQGILALTRGRGADLRPALLAHLAGWARPVE